MTEYEQKLKDVQEQIKHLEATTDSWKTRNLKKESQEKKGLKMKNKKELLNKIVDYEKEFNELSSSLKSEIKEIQNKFNMYAPDVKKNKLNDATEAIKAKYSDKVKALLEKVATNKKDLNEIRLSIQYPKLKNTNVDIQRIGSDEINAAINYMSISRPISTIKASIENALELGRLDFVSSILQGFISQEMDYNNKKGMQLQEYAKEKRIKIFGAKLLEVENQLPKVNELSDNISQYYEAIQDGYYHFIPKNAVEAMGQEAVNKSIDAITKSQEYWTKKD